jgi:hypothetical protein
MAYKEFVPYEWVSMPFDPDSAWYANKADARGEA